MGEGISSQKGPVVGSYAISLTRLLNKELLPVILDAVFARSVVWRHSNATPLLSSSWRHGIDISLVDNFPPVMLFLLGII